MELNHHPDPDGDAQRLSGKFLMVLSLVCAPPIGLFWLVVTPALGENRKKEIFRFWLNSMLIAVVGATLINFC